MLGGNRQWASVDHPTVEVSSMDVAAVSRFLGVLALVAGAVALALVVPWLRSHPAVRSRASRDGTWLAAAVAFVATAGSLYYSEVAGFVPCTLCWAQRAVMYPLAVLLPVLALTRAELLRRGSRLLALGGLGLSAWHVAVQRLPALSDTVSCSASSPCTVAWVEVFGVLTIPTMAGLGFAAVVALTGRFATPAGAA